MNDVLIIGGGLAGRTAALFLAARGLKIAVCSGGWGQTAQFSGIWQYGQSAAVPLPARKPDAEAQQPWTAAQHIADIATHQPAHPFARLGAARSIDAVQAAHAVLQEKLSAPKAVLPEDPLQQAVRWHPNVNGTLVSGVPMAGPEQVHAEGTHVVLDLSAWGAPISPRALMGWGHDARTRDWRLPQLRHVRLPAPAQLPAWASAGPLGLARYLDTEAGTQVLADAAKGALADAQGVILPPVLGLAQTARVTSQLQAAWQIPIFEAAATTPSVPGVRLQQALARACVQPNIAEHGRVASVQTDANGFCGATLADGTQLRARACVLATGRFLSGGLVWPSQGHAHEALLHLPLQHQGAPWVERSPLEVCQRRPEQQHMLLSAGIAYGEDMRALQAHGAPYANVWAIGCLLGGYSERQTPSREGVALATAHQAASGILTSLGGGT